MAYLNAAAGRRRAAGTGKIEGSDLKDGDVTRTDLSGPAKRKALPVYPASIATTGNTDAYVIVPEDGTLDSVDFSALAALTANDSNYITFTITNLGQSGGGSTALLANSNANTTKATGGSGIAANAKRSLTLHGTAANLNVSAGDRLLIRAAATGTLNNAVTVPVFLLRFGGTT